MKIRQDVIDFYTIHQEINISLDKNPTELLGRGGRNGKSFRKFYSDCSSLSTTIIKMSITIRYVISQLYHRI